MIASSSRMTISPRVFGRALLHHGHGRRRFRGGQRRQRHFDREAGAVTGGKTSQRCGDRAAPPAAARSQGQVLPPAQLPARHPGTRPRDVGRIGRDTGTGIQDMDPESAGDPAAADQDAAMCRVAQRVLDQVAQDALQQGRIAVDPARAADDPQADPLAFGALGVFGTQPADQAIGREHGRPGRDGAGVQPGNIEQPVQKALQGIGRLIDAAGQRQHGMAAQALGQGGAQEQQRLDRLSQIMAGGGQEPGFGQGRLFGLGAGGGGFVAGGLQGGVGFPPRAHVAHETGEKALVAIPPFRDREFQRGRSSRPCGAPPVRGPCRPRCGRRRAGSSRYSRRGRRGPAPASGR